MAKYRIKNPEVEKVIRCLYKVNFPFDGLTAYERIPESKVVRFYVDEKSSVGDCNLIFELHENLVEEIVEYNPNCWNEYPKVKPPKKGIYRVEYRFESGEVKKESVHFDGENFVTSWFSMSGGVRTYFKPWDDEK